MRNLILLVIVLTAATARADVQNRDFLPFGERASMLGNAGLCSPFGEAVYYNPANLTRIDHPSLSVSGSTYLVYNITSNPLVTLNGQDEPFSASGFVAIPSTVVSTYKVGDWWLATAVLVPEALDFKNRTVLTSGNLKVGLLEQDTQQSLWLGGSIAHKITSTLAIGVSVFFAHETEAQISFTRATLGNPPTDVDETLSNEDTSVLNFNSLIGIYWEPDPKLSVGFRFRAPAIKISGTTDLYNTETAAGSMPGTTETTINGANAARPLPTDFGIGIAYRPASTVELVADVGIQLPATITTLDDPVAGTRSYDALLSTRIGIGAEFQPFTNKWVRIGALYNRSSVPQPVTDSDPTRDDYFGLTGGVSFASGRTSTSVGVFGLVSQTQVIVTGSSPPRLSDASIHMYGGLLSFAYKL